MLNIQVLEDFITNYRLKVCLDEEKATKNGLKNRKKRESFNRGRRVSEVVRNEENDHTCSNDNNRKVSSGSKNHS